MQYRWPASPYGLSGLGAANWAVLPPSCSAYQMVGGVLCGANPYTGTTSGPQFTNPVTGGLSGPEGYAGDMRPALDSYYPGGAAAFGYKSSSLSMPVNVTQGTAGRAVVIYANPDGSLGHADDKMQYTAGDASFRAPAMSDWQQAVTNLGFAALNTQWTSTYAQLVAQAKADIAANYPVATAQPTNPITGAPIAVTSGTAAPAGSGVSFSFTTSRGGTVLQPGDNWTVKITGATPNQNVSASANKNGQDLGTSVFGSPTDANGNYTLSGQIPADQIGSWSETWFVGNQQVGSANFTVVAAGSAPAPSGSGTGSPAPGGNSTTSTTDWSKIAIYGGVAHVALFMLSDLSRR